MDHRFSLLHMDQSSLNIDGVDPSWKCSIFQIERTFHKETSTSTFWIDLDSRPNERIGVDTTTESITTIPKVSYISNEC